ncbi:plasmid pRiA4b ORF-3 family protein [Hymenobacter lapidiphilus]|uniref:Plasmid pRiA4b ORF-3 family protein n=1 Tax=Hymenobacter lapidiphilus TaxID=2608003 RepID=A0A7Y7PN56_9BACT|nr:plasmid pRiA4b ORF-3 family protein [Hymenobacter lapidiphilus]NVO30910.1 plasmid pRiA4b ORF-3 family protein [Hymenobacter lapidiphilus]
MANLLTLKATLRYTSPPVWRRLTVPDTLTFWELHFALQILFDWESYHLFEFRQHTRGATRFRAGSPSLGAEDPLFDDEPAPQDPRTVPLNAILTAPTNQLTYTYDFGDDWQHDIVVEQVTALVPAAPAPAIQCLGGKRAAPLEDMGGIPGYEQLLDLLAKKAAGKRKRMPSEYAGLGKFDPDAFDLARYNHNLTFMPQIVAEQNRLLAAHQARRPAAD